MIFTYSRNDGRDTIEVDVPQGKLPPPRVRRKGKWWTKNVFAGSTSAHRPAAGWPISSESMAVHPDQIADATEHAKAHGVPTEFNAKGQPSFRTPRHQREYLDIYKCRNLDSYD